MIKITKYLLFIITLTVLFISSQAFARPQKGFHTGPYLALQAGAMQIDFDKNVASDTKVGSDFEPTAGIVFGWNVWDNFAPELQARYTTNYNGGRREHVADAGIYGKWTPIIDSLTDFESLRILPFAKAGISVCIAVLPSDINSSGGNVTMHGVGPALGAGLMFLVKKYIYFGFDVQEELLNFNTITQTVSGVPNTTVYKGGFEPQFSAVGVIGVHY